MKSVNQVVFCMVGCLYWSSMGTGARTNEGGRFAVDFSPMQNYTPCDILIHVSSAASIANCGGVCPI